jgi:polyisoprenoid-binding protein YceI
MKNLLLIVSLMVAAAVNAAEVDLSKSELAWKGTKVTGEHYGKISLSKADLKLNKKGLIKKGELEVNMDSLTITDLTGEWAQKFLGHIKSEDFFDIKKFPTAKLVIQNDTGKELKGKLTIKGKTNKVTIPYSKEGKNYKGVLTFDRTKFDMIYGSKDFFKNLGDKVIHNKVTLDFKVTLK